MNPLAILFLLLSIMCIVCAIAYFFSMHDREFCIPCGGLAVVFFFLAQVSSDTSVHNIKIMPDDYMIKMTENGCFVYIDRAVIEITGFKQVNKIKENSLVVYNQRVSHYIKYPVPVGEKYYIIFDDEGNMLGKSVPKVTY